jgi:hypothetical protein
LLAGRILPAAAVNWSAAVDETTSSWLDFFATGGQCYDSLNIFAENIGSFESNCSYFGRSKK